MSLNSVLHSARRAKVPQNVLAQCREVDRTVVENILTVLQEEIPTLDITSCLSAWVLLNWFNETPMAVIIATNVKVLVACFLGNTQCMVTFDNMCTFAVIRSVYSQPKTICNN